MVELDRTERPSRNFDKFLRYDALITAWWRNVPRYQYSGEPPAVVFVCTDDGHAHGFMEAADRQVIRKALAQTDGNISSAAKLLGISRPTLYDLLKQYGLQG